MRLVLAGALSAVLAPVLAPPATAQASFHEGFESLSPFIPGQLGPASLVQQGWIFRNQSGAGTVAFTWRDGPHQMIPCGVWSHSPQSGAGCLSADWRSSSNGQMIADWAILPPVPGQVAGDVASLFVQQYIGLPGTRVELRYAPGGGDQTGAGPQDVGDFTMLLAEASPPGSTSWGLLEGALPGPGRIAIRYVDPGPVGQCSSGISIDEVHVGAAAPPCPGFPVIPGAGQTVHWTAAGSPYSVCVPAEIPVGATVIVDPGAVVTVEPGADLVVRGELRMGPRSELIMPFDSVLEVHGVMRVEGTAAQPARLSGERSSHGILTRDKTAVRPGGLLVLEHVALETTIGVFGTGLALARHVAASGLRNGFFLDGVHRMSGGQLRIEDSSFTGEAEIHDHGGYLWIDRVTFDDGRIDSFRPWGGQTRLLDGIDATGRVSDAPFALGGGDYLLGPGNHIAGNLYPVTLQGGGLARGSVVPATGNGVDRVHVWRASSEGNVTWARTEAPYYVPLAPPLTTVAKRIQVEPGVRVRLDADARIRPVLGSVLNLEGLPEAPIVFEPEVPGARWFGLDVAEPPVDMRLEHVVVRGATRGVQVTDGYLKVESSTFEQNDVGLLVGQHALIEARGLRLMGNNIGVRGLPVTTGPGSLRMDANSLPSWFEGNGVGLATDSNPSSPHEARGNYWGDPSGPAHPSNPAGTGDAATGFNVVLPFLAAPPPADHAPVVRLERLSAILDEGATHVLHWTARDDGYITRFRVLYRPHGMNSAETVLADNLPGTTRSVQIVVPQAPPASNYTDPSLVRVEAYDDAGQFGWDEASFLTPYLAGFTGGFQPAAPAGPVTVGTTHQIQGTLFGGLGANASWTAELWFDGDDQQHPFSVGFGTTGIFDQDIPTFSTDLARFVTWHVAGAQNQISYSFSDYFTVRPSALLGDAPPQVQLQVPGPGAVFQGDTVLPVSWTASDDEGLRSFDLHASYDGGRTWSDVVTDLGPAARSYAWKLPASGGMTGVLVRVVARDHRFQNTSSTSEPFGVLPAVSQRYCPAVANSTGEPAIVTAQGSRSVLINQLVLDVWQLPRQTLGMFAVNRTAGFVARAGGSHGNLCLGGGIGRYDRPGQIQSSGAAGHVTMAADLASIPTPAGFVAALPGETWRFTYWYRDVVGGQATSNFSDAVAVTFLP